MHNGQDHFTIHTKTVSYRRSVLLPKDSSADRSGLPQRCWPTKRTITSPAATWSRPSRRRHRRYSACLVECRVGLVARWSTYSRSRPESAASDNRHDCFAIDTKMVRRCLFLLFSRNLPTIISPAAIWSHPFCDSWKFNRDWSLAWLPRALSNAKFDRPSEVPHGREADRNPQHRTMVATFLRCRRKWSGIATPLCCQRIYLATDLGFRSVARS